MRRMKQRLICGVWGVMIVAAPFLLAANEIIMYSNKWGD